MKLKIIFPTFLLISSCTTLNDSMMLGATVGALTSVAEMSAANNKIDKGVSNDELASGAGIGIALGLITSYLIHKDVIEKRGDVYQNLPEIHFGDLPPSPFIMSPTIKKKGGK